jgi:hypothetical protein
MRENDIFGVKPFKELLLTIKDQLAEAVEKIIGRQHDDYAKFDKNMQRRKGSDFENVFKAYICKKRKLSEL